MEPVLTPEAMGAADRRTIAAGTPVEVLMERAGRAVAWDVRRMLRGTYGRHVVVVCGKGNNGGDGLVAARHPGALGNANPRVRAGERRSTAPRFDRALATADAAIDAMFGTGFRGALEATRHGSRSGAPWGGPTVAVDIPSGVDGLAGSRPRLRRCSPTAR